MDPLDINKQWEQLNQRTRWYTSQLWYVPFAFIGILALGIEKINSLSEPIRSFVFLMLSFYALSIYVHVSSLKFYERQNVLAMQKLENHVISRGGSPWYLSFTTYLKLFLAFCTVAFIYMWSINFPKILRVALIVISIVPIVLLWLQDKKRNKPIIGEIRANQEQSPKKT
ncbi:MAG: hypothetical protein V1742_08530 [Pseudomonadota bacterium]